MDEIYLSAFHTLLVFGLVLVAHALRARLSLAPLYAALGCLAGVLWLATNAGITLTIAGQTVLVGSVIYYLAIFTGVFLVYVFDGPRASRLAIGAIVTATLIVPVLVWFLHGHALAQDPALAAAFPTASPRVFLSSIVATLLNFLTMAVVWSLLLSRPSLPLVLKVFVTVLIALEVDNLLFVTGAFWGESFFGEVLEGGVISRVVMAGILAPGLAMYIAFQKSLGVEVPIREPLALLTSSNDLLKALEEARQREDRSKAVEQRLRTVLDGIPVMVVGHGEGEQIVYWNSAGEAITGYPRAEIIGQPDALVKLFGSEDRAVGELDQSQHTGRGREMNISRKDGGSRVIHATDLSSSVPIEGWKRWGVAIDITERKRAEAEVRAQRDFYEALFERNQFPTLQIDPETALITEVNPAAAEYYGYPREVMRGMRLFTIAKGSEEDQLGRLQHILRQGHVRFEGSTLRANGEERLMEIYASRIEVEGRALVITQMSDITESRYQSMEIVKQDKLDALGVLAGGIAHDFNNYLGGIAANAQVGLLALEDGDLSDLRGLLGDIDMATQRATGLTQQLRSFARGGTPSLVPVALEEVLRRALSFSMTGSNVAWHLSLPEALPAVIADEGQIAQVVGNLAVNARHAMPEGGQLRIEGSVREVGLQEAASVSPGRYVHVSFEDEGLGIPEEILPRIFDPFFSTKQSGGGLGLTSCYTILKRHNGLITAKNTDRGACFEFWLPVVEGDVSSAGRAEDKGRLRGEGRVLVMDDDEAMQRSLLRLLSSMGFEAVGVCDGEEALEAIDRAGRIGSPFALAILDLTVPGGMGGREVAERLGTAGGSPRLVAISGYSTDDVIANHRAYGFAGAVPKPFTLESFEGVLRTALASEAPLDAQTQRADVESPGT